MRRRRGVRRSRRLAGAGPGGPVVARLCPHRVDRGKDLLVSEVHPFVDGNGRVARTVMNAELTAAGQHRLVVPVVWRNEYLTAMREMSRANDVGHYARTLGFVWRWTTAMNWTDPATTTVQLEHTHALDDSTEAANNGLRLLLPGQTRTSVQSGPDHPAPGSQRH